jgi:glycosyltransferase involved in cell wall biosynthesis
MKTGPKISIVTACFNAVKTIEQTIQSVINQTYENIEYIIVDGASTDGTIDVIRKYEDKIDIIISEGDKGIYDAFNKGANVATGDYIQYLNADDYLATSDVIEGISWFLTKKSNPVLVYGGILMVDEVTDYKIIRNQSVSTSEIQQGKMIPHPATFVRRDILLLTGLFDTQYSIAADYDLICKIFSDYESSIYYYPQLITFFRIGGLSNAFKNRERVKKEVQAIVKKHYNHEINNTLQESNEGYYKKWIEKQIFENKSIANLLIEKNIDKVALWGTGELAIMIYKDLTNKGLKVLFFIDNNEERQGLIMNNTPVLSPKSLKENYIELDCIIMSFEGRHEDSVLQQISGYNMRSDLMLYSWRHLVREL